ncbi:receptor-type guanylate cyclase Gyc76C-like [Tubulanus polymorphus]|uniref:receptor-type guanylate cyclase Gyc76C-like n=1 Tax=Tubulanus polymorphus TaxID=672921 RepID=UPI003DA5EE0D
MQSMQSMVTVANDATLSCKSFSVISQLDPFSNNKAIYNGNVVSVQWIHKKSINFTRKIKLELKQMRDIRHDHLASFLGACVEPPRICIITEYCSKGSLQDILENDDIDLDHMFKASIITDIIQGMIFLHDSLIKTHGYLRSSSCMVDSRWVIKITDFGLHYFKDGQDNKKNSQHAYYRDRLWIAPELLRNKIPEGSQKGDVYSFSIIMYEIFGRCGPYGDIDMEPIEIVKKVAEGSLHDSVPMRPNIHDLGEEVRKKYVYIIALMMDCWNEDPEKRPDFRKCREILKPMRKGLKPNIFDNMMAIMEKYASNLEGLVMERTTELVEEKQKTDALLNRMLPRSVAEQLKKGESVRPESYESTTIYFSDICGFTAMSAESSPLEVVDLLNDLYVLFDSTIKAYDVYKVETIGDAYMVVSGLPVRNGLQHAGEIGSMSLDLLSGIMKFRIRHRPNDMLKLRIGIHTGPCVAGVVGLTMPRYCLFGDTVNTASRMESNGLPLKIHVSGPCKDVLENLGGYQLEERGLVAMKGKGEVKTYWLLAEEKQVRQKRLDSLVIPETSNNHRSTFSVRSGR